jgi:DinB superfamily
MGVTYTQGSDVTALDPKKLSEQLSTVVSEEMTWLKKISDADASQPEREGKWSAKQVIGHLLDSAVNNLGRIVRMQIVEGAKMQGYEQEEWVAIQHYGEREWNELLEAWAVLNSHVAWAVAHVEKARLANRGEIEGSEQTLGFLIEDYIAHMEHHLKALRKSR